MIWVAWRQNRTESFVILGVLVLSGIFLLVTGLNMAHDFQQSGLSDCLAHNKQSAICSQLATAFTNHYSVLLALAIALLLLPILLGAMGGPARSPPEFDQPT